MTIDRKTLELAAKAAGIELYWHYEEGKEPIPFYDLIEWAPHISHGQLHDLAMACQIGIRPLHNCIEYSANDLLNVKSVDCQVFPALAEAVIQAAAEQQQAKEAKE